MAGAATVLGSACSATGAKKLTLGEARPPAELGPDETIRMGLIGTGGMGNGHCSAIMGAAEKGREKVQIVALADVCQMRLDSTQEACARRQGIQVDKYRDYRDMLARDDIHGVLIASPEHWHAQMAADAIVAGKDVYVEKPMTLRLPEAIELREVVHSHDRVLQVGTQKMSLPMYADARRLLAEGAVGHPTCSQTSYCRNSPDGEWNYYEVKEGVEPGPGLDWDAWCGPLGPQPWNPLVYWRWRRYRKFSTGIIGDLLVHQMTPLMDAIQPGWPTRVTACGRNIIDKEMENHDQINLTIEFEKDHIMVVMGSTCNETGLSVMVRGNQGNMSIGGNRVKVDPERPYVDDVDPVDLACQAVQNDQDEHRLDWWRCMRTREEVRSPVDIGLRVMVVVDLATRALWEGGDWRFDPASMKVSKA